MVAKTIPARFTHDRRAVLGVEVFSVGTHTDSDGRELTVTADDLDAIVAAFDTGNPSMVPVKFGHTSDAFNVAQAAELLGVTPGLITGEAPEGDGAVIPGKVTRLARDQTKLIADLDVIAPVADMIMDGLLRGISIEKPLDGNVLSAVTLLGAEHPAVKDLVPIQAASILKGNTAYAFSMSTANATVTRRKFHTLAERLRSLSWFAMDLGLTEGATISDVILRLQQLKTEGRMDETTIRALLKIKDEDDILEAITALKEKAEADPPADPPEPKLSLRERLLTHFKLGKDASEEDIAAKLEGTPDPTPAPAQFSAEVQQGFAERDAKIVALERENTVRKFAAQCQNFSGIQGTPEEKATRLTDIKEKMGDDAVTLQLADWEKQQEYSVAAGVTRSLGSSAPGAPADWDAAIAKWKEDHPREKDQRAIAWEADAIKAVTEEQPALYQAYYKERRNASDE